MSTPTVSLFARRLPFAASRVLLACALAAAMPGRVAAQELAFSPVVPVRTDAATESDTDFFPRLATSGHGTWVAVWTRKNPLDGPNADVLVARSTDRGATWTPPMQLDGDATTQDRYSVLPVLATDGAGTWVVAWSAFDTNEIPHHDQVFVVRSSDDGITWTDPVMLHPGAVAEGGPRIATDGSGTWVIVSQRSDSEFMPHHLAVTRSTDGGISWSPGAPLVTDPAASLRNDVYADIATSGTGTWLVVWTADHVIATEPDSEIVVARSLDAGLTWSAPAALNTNAPLDDAGDYLPHVAGDGAGAWVAVWSRAGYIEQSLVARSLDDGISWSDPQLLNVNSVPGDQVTNAVPWIATDRLGVWLAVWSSTDPLGGANPSPTSANGLIARSTDAGATWSAPVAVNRDVSSDECGYHGDIDHSVVTDAAGDVVVLWGRSRAHCQTPPERPDDDLFVAHVSSACGNGILDSGEACDDGNVRADDGCAANCQFEPCRPQLVADCWPAETAKASLKIATKSSHQLEWKWGRGVVTSAELGDPTRFGDDYHLCVYDQGGLVASTKITAAARCGTHACWNATAGGYEFRETTRRPKSALLLQLKADERGMSRLHFRARDGAALLPALPLRGPVAVQLRRPHGSVCWSATYSPPFLRDGTAGFFARSD